MKSTELNLNSIAGGAFKEKFDWALAEVSKNILDPNTSATAGRKITISINMKPDDDREVIKTTTSVSTSLAPQAPVVTKLIVGADSAGKTKVRELLSGARGQTFFDPEDSTLKEDDGTPVETQPDPAKEPIDFRQARAKAKEAK